MMYPHTRIALVFAALSLTTPALAENCGQLVQRASLDMTRTRGDIIFVPVTVNGTDMHMLVDTGGGISSVSAKTATELKLPRLDSRVKTLDMRGNASRQFVELESFALGPLKGKNVDLMIWPDPNAPFDGLIAGDLLSRYDVEFNFVTGKMNIFSQDHCEGKVIYWPATALAVVPFSMARRANGNPEERATINILPDTHIRVPVALDGKNFSAIVDTGASITTMSAATAKAAFDVTADSPGAATIAPGDPRFGYVFHSLAFEGIAVSNPHVLIHPDLVGKNDPDNTNTTGSRIARMDDGMEPDLIIGMDVLKHLHLYIAYGEKKLYITPPDPPAAAH
ncbi:MAG TPA: retropepsin-like aspartic protease [Rhizomicrobium sp.]|jgi:predicted aspartyl protease|nr:retropepsin-like aspartic protease [Rhizomicrobium sp.]